MSLSVLWGWEHWDCSARRSLWSDLIPAFQCLKEAYKVERDYLQGPEEGGMASYCQGVGLDWIFRLNDSL